MLPELFFPDRNCYRVPYEIAVESKEESQVNSTRTQYLSLNYSSAVINKTYKHFHNTDIIY